jgi:hypothetical protein
VEICLATKINYIKYKAIILMPVGLWLTILPQLNNTIDL